MLDFYPLLRPALPLIDAEQGHRIALWALRNGLLRPETDPDDPVLTTSLLGRILHNPIGLAAGFDKNAIVVNATQAMGFGFIEIGGVTPRPQTGNPRPRLFRLSEDEAVINRMGFNNDGMDVIAARLTGRDRNAGMIGVNMASNSDSTDPAADFDQLVAKFTPLADYMTIDISCPNTPNGKVFQSKQPLAELLERLKATRARVAEEKQVLPPPMLIKSAPDLTEQEKRDIAQVALISGIDGMIVSNTTIARPASLRSRYRSERGGLSGRPAGRNVPADRRPPAADRRRWHRQRGGRLRKNPPGRLRRAALQRPGFPRTGTGAPHKTRSGATAEARRLRQCRRRRWRRASLIGIASLPIVGIAL